MSILVDHNGKALGDAFVQFATHHDAKLAKERNGSKIGHRYIEAFESTIEEANNEIRRQMDFNEMHMARFDKSSPPPAQPRGGGPRSIDGAMPYGESHRFYSRSPVLINMKGVSVTTRPDDVFRFFRPLVPLHITMRFPTGAPDGEVDAEFANEDEGYSAMAKNRDRLGSHSVFLTMLRMRDEFPYSKPPNVGAEYERRDREMSRGLGGPGRGFGDRDSFYPPSRYY